MASVARRKCSKCGLNRAAKFYTSPRGRVCLPCQKKRSNGATRDARLQETYGITDQEHAAIVAYQGGVCAICKGKRSYRLDTDHDHALEKAGVPIRDTIRGGLCRQCNRRILRSVRDSIPILEAAIAYLQDPPARHVLLPVTDGL